MTTDRSEFVSLRNHVWYGHCLWSTYGDAGCLMTTAELLAAYRRATAISGEK